MNGQLDPVIHPLNRFKICAVLNAYGATEGAVNQEMEFSSLAREVDLSPSALSKQLSALQEAEYVSRFREYGSTRGKDTVWVSLTTRGRAAFQKHLTALKDIAG